jgi:predicted secreted protein
MASAHAILDELANDEVAVVVPAPPPRTPMQREVLLATVIQRLIHADLFPISLMSGTNFQDFLRRHNVLQVVNEENQYWDDFWREFS